MDSADGLTGFESYLGRSTFDPPGTPVVCGVSGGADSLALLLLAVAAQLDVTAVHVDHGLRPGGASEADLVRQVAHSVGAAFRAERVGIDPGPNLEERARNARLEALGPGALTGHTADDQAETVLLQLLWGAGAAGLAGMAAGPQKPLLALRRHETEAVCTAAGVRWFVDPSNADRRFRRNRVRQEVIPLLADIADRDVVPLLARTAGTLRSTLEGLDALLPDGDPTDTRWLQTLPPPVAVLVVRAWLGKAVGRPIGADATARVMAVVRHDTTATELVGGWRLSRSGGLLRLERPA